MLGVAVLLVSSACGGGEDRQRPAVGDACSDAMAAALGDGFVFPPSNVVLQAPSQPCGGGACIANHYQGDLELTGATGDRIAECEGHCEQGECSGAGECPSSGVGTLDAIYCTCDCSQQTDGGSAFPDGDECESCPEGFECCPFGMLGAYCVRSGTCCPDGTVSCGDDCVDTQEDSANCGACGNVCDSDELCFAGSCTAYLEPSSCGRCPCPECDDLGWACCRPPPTGGFAVPICVDTHECPYG